MQIKNIIRLLVVIVLIGLSMYCYIQKQELNKLSDKYQKSVANYKASISKNRAFNLRLNEISDQRDSMGLELAKKSKIKPKNIKQIVYLSSEIKIKDTIKVKDTLNVKLDTILHRSWYIQRLVIEKNTIMTELKTWNEFSGIVYSKRETIDPPSKLFFIRWFQKKHTILECNFKNNNPYDSIRNYKITTIVNE